jgi:hypothetical protein
VNGDEEKKKKWARVSEHLATPREKDHSFHISIHLTSLSRVLPVRHTVATQRAPSHVASIYRKGNNHKRRKKSIPGFEVVWVTFAGLVRFCSQTTTPLLLKIRCIFVVWWFRCMRRQSYW